MQTVRASWLSQRSQWQVCGSAVRTAHWQLRRAPNLALGCSANSSQYITRESACQTNFQADDEEERIFVESHIRNLQSLPHAMRKEMNTCQNILLRTAAKQIHRQASRNSTVSYPITPKGKKLRLATKNIREKLIFQTVIH